MKVEIHIQEWASLNTYYSVVLGNATVGCIDANRDGEYYFHSYSPFDRLDNDDKTQVMQVVNDRVAALNITARLMG